MTRKETFSSEYTVDVQTEMTLIEKSFQVDTPPTNASDGNATVTVEATSAGDYYVTTQNKATGENLQDIPFSFAEGDDMSLPITFNIPASDSDYSIIVRGGVVQ